jgi:hypothetical protein
MTIGGPAVFNEDFPDPAQQAEALVEICRGDMCAAQAIIVTNLKYAKCRTDRLYWSRVEAWIANQDQAMVMAKTRAQSAAEVRNDRING